MKKVLSLTEYRIAAMAAEGLSNEEIATAVNSASHTVKTHMTSIYRKLGMPGERFGRSSTQRIKLAHWWMGHQFKTWEEFEQYRRIAPCSNYLEALWELVSKPIKFPNRRRREDREIPKAA